MFFLLVRFQTEIRYFYVSVGEELAGKRKLEFEFALGMNGYLMKFASDPDPNNNDSKEAACNQCDDNGGIVHGAWVITGMIEGQAFPSCNAFARAGQVMPWYCLAPGAARGARGQALRVFE